MKNRISNFIILISSFTIISGCLNEEAGAEYLHEDLEPYFDRFAEEASARDYIFDWQESQIEGFISDLSGNGVLGQCVHDNLEPDKVIIDASFWKNSTDYDREFIVFHELGHCFLNRGHLDSEDSSGICTSIMHSGSVRCRSNYKEITRKQYLDELFTH